MKKSSKAISQCISVMVWGVGAFAHSTAQILKEKGAKVSTYLTRDYAQYPPSLAGPTYRREEFPSPVPLLRREGVELIVPMYREAMSMFKDSVDAYVREDVQLGRDVVPRDEKLDELNRVTSRRLIERMAQDPDQLRGYLNLMFIGRHLERVGDHATNIAEDAVYAAAAEDIRHQPFVAPA